MSNTLELHQVCKSYDHFVAVDHLSFNVRAGSIYGLLGPNGAGKTSTLRMMIGIMLPDSGQVRVFAEQLRRQHLKRIGYLPEERGLYKRMKLLDHLVLLGQLKGVPEREVRRNAARWCDRLELSPWMDRKVEELSKGMQQKVQFIAAILHDPELLILDEPFAGLDPSNVVLLKDLLLEMKAGGRTILFSTHRMDQVERLCEAICLIDHGQAVLEGDLKQIKSRYGKRNVQIEYEGDGDFLDRNELVQSFNNYGNYAEVRLKPGADPQALLHMVAARSRVSKFEVVEPSLEQIFIETVGKQNA